MKPCPACSRPDRGRSVYHPSGLCAKIDMRDHPMTNLCKNFENLNGRERFLGMKPRYPDEGSTSNETIVRAVMSWLNRKGDVTLDCDLSTGGVDYVLNKVLGEIIFGRGYERPDQWERGQYVGNLETSKK